MNIGKHAKRRRVTFSLKVPRATKVSLVGNFNNWDPGAHPMKKGKQGMWTKIVMLSPGEYEYKFIVNGAWWTDPLNELTCPNPFGTRNSIITIV